MFNKKQTQPAEGGNATSFSAKALAFFERYSYVGCAFLIPLLIFFIVYIFFEVYPFGNGSVLVLDLNGQYVFFFEALRNALHGDTSLIYSWSRSLGGEFIGIYAYYIASPLSYLVAFFSENHITEALLTIILLKTGISGAAMAFYLKKTRPDSKELAVVTFSTMYALSAYAVTYAHNTMWIDAMMLLPLVIYGLEKLVDEHKFLLYTVTLTLTLVSTFYIGYMVCFFVFVYFFYYCFVSGAKRENNYYGERFHFPKSLLRVGVASLASLLMACIIILPTYYSLQFGKTTFTDTTWEFVSQFNLLDFFAKMLPGSYDTVRPEGLPFVYCGTLALIMVPVFFAAKNIHIREKIGAAAILSIVLFSMNSMVIDTFLHGMQRPNWLNYRYSFVFIFLIIVFACRGFSQILTVKKPFILVIGGIIIALTLLVQKLGFSHLDPIIDSIDYTVLHDYYCIWFTIVCVIAYLISLRFVISTHMKSISMTALTILVCFELFGSSMVTSVNLDRDVGMSSREGYVEYFDNIRPLVEQIQESDTSFYRMEKTYIRSVCDDLALNIRGVSCSTSTLNASVIEFLERMGYASSSHWSRYSGGNMVSDSLLGIKYIITQRDKESTLLAPYAEDAESNLYAYLNAYALSMAYSSNSAINDLKLSDYDTPFEALNAMVTALTGSEETIELFKPIEHSMSFENAYESFEGNVYEDLTDEEGNKVYDEEGNVVQKSIPYIFYKPRNSDSPGKLSYNISIDPSLSDADVYYYLPTNYPREATWELFLTDEGADPESLLSGVVHNPDNDCIQSAGVLNGGSSYRVTLTLNETDKVLYVMDDEVDGERLFHLFYYLDHEVFKQVFGELAEGNWTISDDYSDTRLEGTVNVPAGDTVMFTSIPYDEGWTVYVDGEKVDIYRTCGALIGFDITEGEHTIKMVYFSSAMGKGLILFFIGLALFIAMVLLDIFVFRRLRAGKHEAYMKKLEELRAKELEEKAELERLIATRNGDAPPDGSSDNTDK